MALIRVASIGECMIELRHRSATVLDLAYGGDTLNTAVYLARLTGDRNVRIDYVSALGDDAYSDGMLAMWRDERIGVDLVARLPGRLPGLHAIRTDARGERVVGNPIRMQHVMATLYRVLGIDPATTFTDYNGRPQYLLDDRQPVAALL